MIAKPDAPDNDFAFLRGGGEAAVLIAALDWAATSLGPIQAWPEYLRAAVSLLLQSPIAMLVLWGPDGVMIYNDAYSRQMGRDHPRAMGAAAHHVWPEHNELIDQVLAAGLAGRTLSRRDQELLVERSGRYEPAWFDIDCSPVRDAAGAPVGALVVSVETTQRVLAERKAARKLETQREMFEQAPGFICLLSGPDLIVEFTNAAHRRLFGVHDAEGRPYMEAYAEIAARGTPEILFQVYESGERYIGRAEPVVIPRPGEPDVTRLLDLMLVPVIDDEGDVRGLFLEGFDVTDQVEAQRAAEESTRRLGAALALASLGAFEWESETNRMVLDSRAREIFGFGPEDEATREEMIARIDPQDHVRIQAEAAAAETEGRARREYEFRIHLPNGAVRRIASVSDGSWTQNGAGRRFIGLFDDVTERRAAERRQRMLINELNHRVKNTLATVQSIAAQTLRAAPNVASAREDFESRLVALAAAHDLLTAQGWRGAPLEDVVATALAAFESVQRPQIRRGGPRAWVDAQQALALNLGLHELATNASKYGALSVAEGRVNISWVVEGDVLTLRWTETEGPPVTGPTRSGFGSRLLQRSLARELGGEVDWTLPAAGARCQIRFRIGAPAPATPLEVAEAAAVRFNF